MEKRYQVFVSSTFADLQQERRHVMQTLMEMDCIPAGMELFPAADDEQWQFIKRVIDDCDYYILIIGGRYGSLTIEGISFTEKEFDYAISKGLKVLAFVHEAPGEIALEKSDIDPALRAKLDKFRSKVCEGRIVKLWRSAAELPGLVALSLQKTIKAHPAIGWVRGGGTSNPELLNDLNNLRKQNELLTIKIAQLQTEPPASAALLAGLDETFVITLQWKQYNSNRRDYHYFNSQVGATWEQIFSSVAPSLEEHPADGAVRRIMAKALGGVKPGDARSSSIQVDDSDFQTIRVQLSALGFIATDYLQTTAGGMGFFWSLTPRGRQVMLQLRTVKSKKEEQ